MAQASAESPKRAWLKAAEVCEVAQLQPYVLRTWEMEFTDLGVTKTPGGPRVYRKVDLDRVLRIKQLVFGEGLTLAGARKKIDEERGLSSNDELPFDDEPLPPIASLNADARKRIFKVRDELRSLLALLSRPRGNGHAVEAVAIEERHEHQAPKARKAPAAKAAKNVGPRKTAASRGKK